MNILIKEERKNTGGVLEERGKPGASNGGGCPCPVIVNNWKERWGGGGWGWIRGIKLRKDEYPLRERGVYREDSGRMIIEGR